MAHPGSANVTKKATILVLLTLLFGAATQTLCYKNLKWLHFVE